MKLNKIKKVCSFLLVTVLMVNLFVQYSPELTKVSAAGPAEPTYDAAVHVSKYYEETLNVSGSNTLGGVTTDSAESYYLSFNVKDTGTFYLNLRGNANVRFAINKTQCYIFEAMAGIQATIASYAFAEGTGIDAETGADVTIYCQPDKVSVWVNGTNVIDAAELRTKTYAGTPAVNWAASATLSNVRIWTMTNAPVYDANSDDLQYENASFAVDNTAFDFQGAADQTYYMSFDLNVTNGSSLYLNLRGTSDSDLRLVLASSAIYVQEKGANTKTCAVSGLHSDARITICSEPDKVSVWVNHQKMVDAHPLVEACQNLVGKPWAKYNTSATLSDVKIWTVKAVSDEPVYDEKSNDLQYENASFTVDNTAFGFQSAADQTYYMSFDLNVTNTSSLYFNLRGTDDNGLRLVLQSAGKIYVQEKQGTVTNQAYAVAGLFSNARITICSEPDKVSVWVNHQKIIDARALTAEYQNLVGKPNAKYNTSATLSDVKIWTAKEVSDEPVYNSKSDVLHSSIDTLNLEKENFAEYSLCSALPTDTTYYTSFTVTSANSFYFRFRGAGEDVRLILTTNSYGVDLGANKDAENNDRIIWTSCTTGLATGTKVTICSTPTKVSMWLNGKKVAVDKEYDADFQNKTGQPTVQWITADATLAGVKTWTTKKNPDDWYDVKYFRSADGNHKIPKKADKVFAGWYTNDVFLDQMTALPQEQMTGEAYALFVDANVLKVGTQLTAGTTLESDTTDLRLVTTVDSLMYKKVGFNVTFSSAKGKDGDRESRTVYKTIKGKTENESVTYMANAFSRDSKYFMTYVFTGIPKNIFDTETFTVTPYWVTLDGTKVTGNTSAFKISSLI